LKSLTKQPWKVKKWKYRLENFNRYFSWKNSIAWLGGKR